MSSTGSTTLRPLRQALIGVFVLGVRRRDPGAVVNATVAYAGTYLPDVLERACDLELERWQRQYVDVAMGLHAVGMLGPYDEVWWWDHLTHTLSASVLGGAVFTAARRRGRDPRPVVLGTVVGSGLLWELIEYAVHTVADRLGLEPVLVFYSRTDTVLDLAFNLLGALLVLAFGDRVLDNLFPSAAEERAEGAAAQSGSSRP